MTGNQAHQYRTPTPGGAFTVMKTPQSARISGEINRGLCPARHNNLFSKKLWLTTDESSRRTKTLNNEWFSAKSDFHPERPESDVCGENGSSRRPSLTRSSLPSTPSHPAGDRKPTSA